MRRARRCRCARRCCSRRCRCARRCCSRRRGTCGDAARAAMRLARRGGRHARATVVGEERHGVWLPLLVESKKNESALSAAEAGRDLTRRAPGAQAACQPPTENVSTVCRLARRVRATARRVSAPRRGPGQLVIRRRPVVASRCRQSRRRHGDIAGRARRVDTARRPDAVMSTWLFDSVVLTKSASSYRHRLSKSSCRGRRVHRHHPVDRLDAIASRRSRPSAPYSSRFRFHFPRPRPRFMSSYSDRASRSICSRILRAVSSSTGFPY